MSRKAVVWCFVILVICAAGTAGVLYWFNPGPVAADPALQTPQTIAKYVASPEFEKLSADQKDQYFDVAVKQFDNRTDWISSLPDMTEDERRRLERNARPMFEKMAEQQINQYFDLPEEQRPAFLDKQIDEMEAMRKRMQERFRSRAQTTAPASVRRRPPRTTVPASTMTATAPTTETAANPRPQRGRPSLERMRNRIETTDPAVRAKNAEYRRQLRIRMQQRGITFGFGRPGGDRPRTGGGPPRTGGGAPGTGGTPPPR